MRPPGARACVCVCRGVEEGVIIKANRFDKDALSKDVITNVFPVDFSPVCKIPVSIRGWVLLILTE